LRVDVRPDDSHHLFVKSVPRRSRQRDPQSLAA
jgi:hypothetical protein